MRKGFLGICSILAVTIMLLAVLVPGCTTPATTGTIVVKATFNSAPWTGAVSYKLSPTSGTDINGTTVAANFTVAAGNWTCAYVSGGPGTLDSITPSSTQSVAAGETKTFTLNFVTAGPMQVDAYVTFKGWTINGTPVMPPIPPVIWLPHNTYIDAEFDEHVAGEATGTVVPVHQVSWLKVHNTGEEGGGQGMPITLHVVNAPGAVTMLPPANSKTNQTCTVGGQPVAPCDLVILPVCETITLDVEVDWELEICTQYTKTINWIGYPSPPEILFDAQIVPPFHTITLIASACVYVGEGFEDTNPDNNCSGDSAMLTIGFLP